jgi:hypothetical protein
MIVSETIVSKTLESAGFTKKDLYQLKQQQKTSLVVINQFDEKVKNIVKSGIAKVAIMRLALTDTAELKEFLSLDVEQSTKEKIGDFIFKAQKNNPTKEKEVGIGGKRERIGKNFDSIQEKECNEE